MKTWKSGKKNLGYCFFCALGRALLAKAGLTCFQLSTGSSRMIFHPSHLGSHLVTLYLASPDRCFFVIFVKLCVTLSEHVPSLCDYSSTASSTDGTLVCICFSELYFKFLFL